MSVVRLCYAAVPSMRAQRSGSIVAMTSVSVKQPLPNLILSNSLRMAVVGLVKTLSDELAPDGIRVNAVCPGWTRTERVVQLLRDRAARNGTTVDEEEAKITAAIPLGRMATPEEVARAVAFMASPAASYITGISLLVGGIGIMNIMLVSVTERTREIGLRKAVGAKRRDILLQFLIEALTLCLIGGAAGILLGFGLSLLGTFILVNLFQAEGAVARVYLGNIALATGIAAAVGVIFGFFPAFQASRLNPIEALRTE